MNNLWMKEGFCVIELTYNGQYAIINNQEYAVISKNDFENIEMKSMEGEKLLKQEIEDNIPEMLFLDDEDQIFTYRSELIYLGKILFAYA